MRKALELERLLLARLVVVSNRVAVPSRDGGSQAGGLAVAIRRGPVTRLLGSIVPMLTACPRPELNPKHRVEVIDADQCILTELEF